jgi:hypothetical protein
MKRRRRSVRKRNRQQIAAQEVEAAIMGHPGRHVSLTTAD